jgi:raffinose/stachyose/melibiose transport system substrate-binding protein
MKKIIALVVVLVLVSATLLSCAATPAPSASAPASAAAPASTAAAPASSAAPSPSASAKPFEGKTLSIMASQDWVQPAEQTDLTKKFQDQTGAKIDWQIIPSDQYPNVLQTKLNSGNATDIFWSQGGKFDIVSTLNVEKNAVDLSSEAWASTVDPLATKELTANGKLYGQPMADVSAVWAVAYNKQIFTKLNLSVPKTWADFMADCDAIQKAGITPVYESVSDGWHQQLWFLEMGPAIEKADAGLADKLNSNTAKFADSKAAAQAIDQIKDMVTKGYWGKTYMANKYADAPKAFATGKYAMSIQNEGFSDLVNKADPKFSADDVGYFVMPILDNQQLNVNPVGPSRFINSASKNIDLAKAYLAFVAQTDNLQYLIDNTPKYMTLPYTGVKAKYTATIQAFYDAYKDHGTVYQTAVKYVNPQWMDVGKLLVNVLLGKSTSAQMLTAIDKGRADQAKTAKDTAWQ